MNYTKAIVICHGKSENILANSIKQNLRIPIEIYSNNKGASSIQITSLNNHLSNKVFSSYNGFKNKFKKVEFKKRVPQNIKIFIIMDTDDCSKQLKKRFIDKTMFKSHWLYQFIEPIYNIENLEDILKECDIKYDIKKSKVNNYLSIFPKGNGNVEEVELLKSKFAKSKKSNLVNFISYCLDNRTTFKR